MERTDQYNVGWSEDETFVVVDVYDGETKSGKRHGRGIYFYPNGDIYDGKWRKSQKYGYGTYIYSNNQKYVSVFSIPLIYSEMNRG